MQVQVIVTGLTETQARLVSLGKAFYDFEPEMKMIGDELKTYFSNDIFISEGEDFGQRWQALAPSTLAYKLAHYDGRGILERSGDLKEGYTADADKTSVFITNPVPYFVYHQSEEEPRTRLPRRQLIGVTPKVKTIVGDIIGLGVRTRVERSLHG